MKKNRNLIVTLMVLRNDETEPTYITSTVFGKRGDVVNIAEIIDRVKEKLLAEDNKFGFKPDDELAFHIISVTPMEIKLWQSACGERGFVPHGIFCSVWDFLLFLLNKNNVGVERTNIKRVEMESLVANAISSTSNQILSVKHEADTL